MNLKTKFKMTKKLKKQTEEELEKEWLEERWKALEENSKLTDQELDDKYRILS